MIQSWSVHSVESPGTRAASSGGGAFFASAPHARAVAVTRCTPAPVTRTMISARAGITVGLRMMTRTGYGPALPSKYASGLPT